MTGHLELRRHNPVQLKRMLIYSPPPPIIPPCIALCKHQAPADSTGVCKSGAHFIFHETHYSHSTIPAFNGTQYCWNTDSDSWWGLNVHLMYLKNVDPDKHGGVKGM